MLERMNRYTVKHRKSGKPFSDLQRLNLFYQWQRRDLLGAIANVTQVGSRNPDTKRAVGLAVVALSDALRIINQDYLRDVDALKTHKPQGFSDTVAAFETDTEV